MFFKPSRQQYQVDLNPPETHEWYKYMLYYNNLSAYEKALAKYDVRLKVLKILALVIVVAFPLLSIYLISKII